MHPCIAEAKALNQSWHQRRDFCVKHRREQVENWIRN